MTEVVIAIGSNYERDSHIICALDSLEAEFGCLKISPVYESEAVQSVDAGATNHAYYNLVVSFKVSCSVFNLKEFLRKIEEDNNRERSGSIVTLDLDLLLYGDWVGALDNNAVPHHDISRCAYVLRPLADLLPQDIHPVYKKTYAELWKDFEEDAALYPVDFVWKDNVISVSACLQPI